jgi:hypothetical protein
MSLDELRDMRSPTPRFGNPTNEITLPILQENDQRDVETKKKNSSLDVVQAHTSLSPSRSIQDAACLAKRIFCGRRCAGNLDPHPRENPKLPEARLRAMLGDAVHAPL